VHWVDLVNMFDKKVRYVKKVKNHWPWPTISNKTVTFFIRSQLKHHLLCINTHNTNTSTVHEYQLNVMKTSNSSATEGQATSPDASTNMCYRFQGAVENIMPC